MRNTPDGDGTPARSLAADDRRRHEQRQHPLAHGRADRAGRRRRRHKGNRHMAMPMGTPLSESARRCRRTGRACRSRASATAPGRSISTPYAGASHADCQVRIGDRDGRAAAWIGAIGDVIARHIASTGCDVRRSRLQASARRRRTARRRGRRARRTSPAVRGRCPRSSRSRRTSAEADGTTALHWATDRDDLAIGGAAGPGRRQRQGGEPLRRHAAVLGGRQRQRRDDRAAARTPAPTPNAALPEGETALMTAARTGKVDAVRLLLAHGAHVNAREGWKQQTALMWAAHEGNAETVEAPARGGREASTIGRSSAGRRCCLRRARARSTRSRRSSPAARTSTRRLPDGTSALVTAVQGLNYEAAACCWSTGIDPNAAGQGWTALHQIAWSRRPQRGQNNPGSEAAWQRQQPRPGAEARRARRRHQRPTDEGARTRTWRAATA